VAIFVGRTMKSLMSQQFKMALYHNSQKV